MFGRIEEQKLGRKDLDTWDLCMGWKKAVASQLQVLAGLDRKDSRLVRRDLVETQEEGQKLHGDQQGLGGTGGDQQGLGGTRTLMLAESQK